MNNWVSNFLRRIPLEYRLVLGWSVAVFLIAALAHLIFPAAPNSDYTWATKFMGAQRYVTPLVRFDAAHYLRLALAGYKAAHSQLQAFFPLWPGLLYGLSLPLRLVMPAVMAVVVTAITLPALLFLAGVGRFKALLRLDERDPQVVTVSILLLVTFPFAFFYLSPYTESLFLLLLVSSMLAARQRRWWLAGILAALATATRLPAMVLCLALVVEYLHQRNWQWRQLSRDGLWLLVTPLGAIAYFGYLQLGLGSWRLYFDSYHSGWPERIFNPNIFEPFWRVFHIFVTMHSLSLNNLLAIVVTIAALFLLTVGWRELRPSYRVYCVASMVLPLITTTLDGLPRYYMMLFPLYLVAARFLVRRPTALGLWLYVNGLLSGLLVALFTSGFFVA